MITPVSGDTYVYTVFTYEYSRGVPLPLKIVIIKLNDNSVFAFSGHMSLSLDSLPSKSTRSADVRSSQNRYWYTVVDILIENTR